MSKTYDPVGNSLRYRRDSATGAYEGIVDKDDNIVIDVTAASLASPTGAAGVGWIRSAIAAVARYVSDKLHDNYNIFDHFTLAEKIDALSGTPAIDTSDKIIAAIAGAKLAGQRLTGYGTFRVTKKITFTAACDLSDVTLMYYGSPAIAAELSTGSAADPLDVLTTSTQTRYVLPHIRNMSKPATGWAGQGIGWRYVNVQNAQIVEGLVEGFNVSWLAIAFSQVCGYNTVIAGYSSNGKIARQASNGDIGGACNRWDVIGGRVYHASAEGAATSAQDMRHLVIDAVPVGWNIINDWNFSGGSFEGTDAPTYKPTYHFEIGGSNINFFAPRFEISGGGTMRVHFSYNGVAGEGSSCSFVNGRGVSREGITWSADVGAGDRINQLSSIGGGMIAVPNPALVLRNNVSAANPVMVAFESSTSVLTGDPATEYGGFFGSQKIGGKRASNAYDRIYMDLVNSRLYFGDGASGAPTKYLTNQSSYIGSNSGLIPTTDNSLTFGLTSFRWSATYTGILQLSVATPTGAAGTVSFGSTVSTTVGAAGGASALPGNPAGYLTIDVAGTKYKVPYWPV